MDSSLYSVDSCVLLLTLLFPLNDPFNPNSDVNSFVSRDMKPGETCTVIRSYMKSVGSCVGQLSCVA